MYGRMKAATRGLMPHYTSAPARWGRQQENKLADTTGKAIGNKYGDPETQNNERKTETTWTAGSDGVEDVLRQVGTEVGRRPRLRSNAEVADEP